MTAAGAVPNNHHLEASLEEFFRKQVRLVGGLVIKLAPTQRGIPDRLVILPGGRITFVELKAEDGRLSEIQKAMHARFAEKGVAVLTLTGRDEVKSWLGTMVEMAGPKFRNRSVD